MRTGFEIEGKRYEVELCGGGESPLRMTINGKPFDLEFISNLEEKRMVVVKNSKPYEVLLKEDSSGNIEFYIGGSVLSASFADDKDIKKLAASNKGAFGGKVVSSIMPGKVVKVFAKVGMSVKKGDPLLVVEAMKMENELKSPSAGVVKQVNAKVGKTIGANAPLIVIE